MDDDGTLVEPKWYIPIIPMILVNGSKELELDLVQIFHVLIQKQIVEYMIAKIKNKPTSQLNIDLYYQGFKGTIEKVESQKYLIRGVYEIVDAKTVHITELPVGTWTDSYKAYLEKMIYGNGRKRKTVLLKTMLI